MLWRRSSRSKFSHRIDVWRTGVFWSAIFFNSMILVSDILDEVKASLDAEGDDHYTFPRDYLPALNNSMFWIMSILKKAMSEAKFADESFSDISVVRVFITSTFSRVEFNPSVLGHEVFTISAVIAKPVTYPNDPIPPAGTPVESSPSDEMFVRPGKPVHLMTIEEISNAVENIYAPGYAGSGICDNLKTYAYLPATTFINGTYEELVKEITISPPIPREYVAISYLRSPDLIEDEGDSMPFPLSLKPMIVARTLQFISDKQGDSTNLYSVSAQDVKNLIQSI